MWIVSGAWHSGLFPPWAAFSPDYPYAGFFDCRALLDKGFAVFFVRHGDGSKFPMPEIVDDCRRAIRFLRLNARKYNVDPDRLGALGGSAGGHLVLMLSTTSDEGVPNPKNFDGILRYSDRIATAVAYYPPTDIRDWWATGKVKYYEEAFKFDPKRGAEFSPLLCVTPYSAPALMIHGDKDVSSRSPTAGTSLPSTRNMASPASCSRSRAWGTGLTSASRVSRTTRPRS